MPKKKSKAPLRRKKALILNEKRIIAISSIVFLFFVIILFLILEIANFPAPTVKTLETNTIKQLSYSNFKTPDGFSVDYPHDWQKIDQGLETGFLLAAVDSSGAQVGIIESNFTAKDNLGEMLDKRVANFSQLGPLVILNKTINESDGLVEFTVGISNRPLRSLVKATLDSGKKKVYFVMVSAPVDQYDKYKEIIQHIINSIKLD
jgi:hypothetical protein